MPEATIIYSADKKGYLLLLDEHVAEELGLCDQSGKPYEIYHPEQSLLEELAGEIQKTRAIYQTNRRSMLRRAGTRKAFLILVLVLVLSMVFVNRQVAAYLNINLLLFNILVTLIGVAVFVLYLKERLTGGISRPLLREMLELVALKEKIRKHYSVPAS